MAPQNPDTAATTDTPMLTPDELVQRWRNRVTPKTLTNWRSAGTGPKYVRLGNQVLYRLEDVEAYEEAAARGGGGSDERAPGAPREGAPGTGS